MNKGKRTEIVFCLFIGVALLFLVCFSGAFGGNSSRVSMKSAVKLDSETEKKDGVLIHTIVLPEDFEEPQTILFKTTHTIVEVLLDQEVIYQYGREENAPDFMKSPGSLWHFAEIPGDSAGKTLEVRIIPVYNGYYGNTAVFEYGSRNACVMELFRSFLPVLIINCIIIFAGILSLILHFATFRRRKQEEIGGFWCVGLLSLTIAVWSLCQSGFLQFLIPDGRTLYYVDFFSFYLFPVPFNLFVYDISRSKYRKGFLWFSWAYLINMGLTLFLQMLGIIDIFATLPVTHVIMAANVVYVFKAIHYEASKGDNPFAQKFKFPLYMVMIFSATELVAYYARGFRKTSVFLPVGTIVFIIMLIWIQVIRYYKVVMDEEKITYLKKLANIDMLTEALNRNAYENTVKYLEEQEVEIQTTGLLLFDVNDMKCINDQYGHESGDEALKYCYQCICKAFDAEGNCFRIGGDEFACVFNKNEKPELEMEMKKFNLLVKEASENLQFPFSVSVGYACYEEGVDVGFKDIVRRSDAMMYREKRKRKLLDTAGRREKQRGIQKGLLAADYEEKVLQAKKYQEISVEELCEFIDLLNPSTNDCQYILDFRSDFYYIAPHALNRFLIEVNSFHNVMENHRKFVYSEDYDVLKAEFDDLLHTDRCLHNMEYRWLDINGNPVWINCRGYVVRDDEGKALYMVGCINEIGARQKADNVSGLLGESSLQEYLDKWTGHFPNGYLLRIGIDDSREINEKFGVECSDMILRETAACISRNISSRQRLYKMTEDELLVLDFSGGTATDARILFEKVREAAGQFVEDNGFEVVFTVSGGTVPCSSLEEHTYSNAMMLSKFALDEARMGGKNHYYLFSHGDYRGFLRKQNLSRILRKSVNHGYEGFEAFYQPLFRSEEGRLRLYGAEALLRFHSEEYGQVSPAEFIPILEETGLIIPVGRWILHNALKSCRLIRENIPDFYMSINFSHVQASRTNIVQEIASAAREAGVPASAVILELTESGLLKADQNAGRFWSELDACGIKLALDDFGTGYSNFQYLSELKPHIIKIDRSFVEKAMVKETEYNLLSLLCSMAHQLKLKLCIEGIENEKEWEIVRSFAPDYCQGFFFGKPCPYEEFTEKFVEARDSRYISS